MSSKLFRSKNNPIEQYENRLKEQIDIYAAKTARAKYAKDLRYTEFHSSIWVGLPFSYEFTDDEILS